MFIAFTIDAGGNGTLYINGTPTDSGVMDPITTDGPLTLGNSLDDPNFSYSAIDGLVDELMIFNSVLSAAQVAQLYNSGAGKFYGP
jgi:hypothetical protein